jgi:hypothetical protein
MARQTLQLLIAETTGKMCSLEAPKQGPPAGPTDTGGHDARRGPSYKHATTNMVMGSSRRTYRTGCRRTFSSAQRWQKRRTRSSTSPSGFSTKNVLGLYAVARTASTGHADLVQPMIDLSVVATATPGVVMVDHRAPPTGEFLDLRQGHLLAELRLALFADRRHR